MLIKLTLKNGGPLKVNFTCVFHCAVECSALPDYFKLWIWVQIYCRMSPCVLLLSPLCWHLQRIIEMSHRAAFLMQCWCLSEHEQSDPLHLKSSSVSVFVSVLMLHLVSRPFIKSVHHIIETVCIEMWIIDDYRHATPIPVEVCGVLPEMPLC